MSQKLIRYKNWNITKTDMSPKLICCQNWNVVKTEMLLVYNRCVHLLVKHIKLFKELLLVYVKFFFFKYFDDLKCNSVQERVRNALLRTLLYKVFKIS